MLSRFTETRAPLFADYLIAQPMCDKDGPLSLTQTDESLRVLYLFERIGADISSTALSARYRDTACHSLCLPPAFLVTVTGIGNGSDTCDNMQGSCLASRFSNDADPWRVEVSSKSE